MTRMCASSAWRRARLRFSLAARAATPRGSPTLAAASRRRRPSWRKGEGRWWWTCQTCEQEFTGAMRIGLANAWWSQVRDRAEEDRERLAAASNLATSLYSQGKYAEAEEMQRAVLAVRKRVLGAEHPATLTTAGNLAVSMLALLFFACTSAANSRMRGRRSRLPQRPSCPPTGPDTR